MRESPTLRYLRRTISVAEPFAHSDIGPMVEELLVHAFGMFFRPLRRAQHPSSSCLFPCAVWNSPFLARCRDSSTHLPMPPAARLYGCATTTSARTISTSPWRLYVIACLDALQSASVSSVETKSLLSDWPLPKDAGSAGSSFHRRTSQSHTLGESGGDSQPPEKRQKPAFMDQLALRHGSSKAKNFNGVQFWSSSLVSRTKLRLRSSVQALTLLLTKSNAREAVIIPAFYSTPSLLVNSSWKLACTGQSFKYTIEKPACGPPVC